MEIQFKGICVYTKKKKSRGRITIVSRGTDTSVCGPHNGNTNRIR